MAFFEKLFGGLKMSWPVVVVFALVAGVGVGLIASCQPLQDTSFHDIAVSQEWWVIFAFIIATNCKKNWESALKVFVFFLISQPLIYAVEVALGMLDADMAIYYYRVIWGPATLFTLPGGFIAFYLQRKDTLGSVILGLGCALQLLLGASYVQMFLANPPYHLLTVIVCVASVIIFTLTLQKTKKNRLIVVATALAAFVLAAVFVIIRNTLM